jgi:hypothetical protein
MQSVIARKFLERALQGQRLTLNQYLLTTGPIGVQKVDVPLFFSVSLFCGAGFSLPGRDSSRPLLGGRCGKQPPVRPLLAEVLPVSPHTLHIELR